jgi:hypothetical protein
MTHLMVDVTGFVIVGPHTLLDTNARAFRSSLWISSPKDWGCRVSHWERRCASPRRF